MDPQVEAITILREVIRDITSPSRDFVAIMRRCQHVCEILGWQPAKAWFHQELNGYYPDTPLPPHRKIHGIKKWQFEGSRYENIQYLAEEATHGLDQSIYDEEADILHVTDGISWFLAASQIGYNENLPDNKKTLSPSRRREVTLRRIRSFQPSNIAYSLSQIEKNVFDWVSNSYVQLQYGNRVKEIWERYRSIVDTTLQQLGLANHLSAIEDGIGRDNPESWRAAVLECRNMLNDLANYLWQDPRETYEHLPGAGSKGRLDVCQGSYANRLSAYFHQKSVTGTEGKFLRNEAERLSVSIKSLISLESSAHNPINKPIADTVILFTYFLIGELAIKTDLSPIIDYKVEVT
jgi:hypothetical protein